MATQADLDAAIDSVNTLVNDLAKWFNIIGKANEKLSDPEAARVAALCVGGSKAAKRLGTGIVNLVNISNEVAVEESVNWGKVTFNFAGGIANEADTQTVVGQPWVVDDVETPVFTYSQADAGTSDVAGNRFIMDVGTYVAGVGFNITMQSLLTGGGLPAPASFDGYWFRFP